MSKKWKARLMDALPAIILVTFLVSALTGVVMVRKAEERATKHFSGVVEEVRYASSYQVSGTSDATVGAIAGGLLFGPVGAVVGATTGSSAPVGQVEIIGCRFTVRFSNGETRVFHFESYQGQMEKCILLRKGDIESFNQIGSIYNWTPNY